MYLGANRFPKTWENGIQTSRFVFRLPTTSEIGIQLFFFFFFRFLGTLKTKLELLFSFFVFPSLKRIAIAFPFFILCFRMAFENGICVSIFVSRFRVQ